MSFELTQPPFTVTDDPADVDLEFVCDLLDTSYWAAGRPREITAASWQSPAVIPFTALLDGQPVGFARVITDRLTFAWVADVMVAPAHRGQGVAKLIVRAIVEHPDLQHFVRMTLATKDAHGLYEQFGFFRRELMWRNAAKSQDPLR